MSPGQYPAKKGVYNRLTCSEWDNGDCLNKRDGFRLREVGLWDKRAGSLADYNLKHKLRFGPLLGLGI